MRNPERIYRIRIALVEFDQVRRADGFAWCMSGANSALAAGAYARSRAKLSASSKDFHGAFSRQ